ncbi:hypothetical protein KKHLCK_15280 [Candidatus Electrothrix laxa]
MKKKTLVVNGQQLNLRQCGGAGRYSRQLYNSLIDSKNAKKMAGIDIFFEGFEEIASLNGPSSNFTNTPLDRIKHAIYRSCPPVAFDRMQQLYQYVSRGRKAPTPVSELTGINSERLWISEKKSVTLLHEITNYTSIDEIGRLILSSNFLLIVTFLDIQDFFYPEYFTDRTLRLRRLYYSFYKDRADYFFAISENTKHTMVERLGIKPEKIKVTHLAADDMLILAPSEQIVNWIKFFGRYWIYPAKAWKHKNHDFLLKSIGKRKGELKRAGIKLLLTGGFSNDDNLRLSRLVCDNNLHGIVEILGFVSDEQLQALIKGADYLVFPSLFEGFGMPILEAMTLGCPVLSSNAGSLPEVGGDAAIYFDPTREDEFVALIDSVLRGSGIDRDLIIQKGYENSKRFSWEKTYRETVEVYKELL